MTWDYNIGELKIEVYDDPTDLLDQPYLTPYLNVELLTLDEAPALPGAILSKHSNIISIPYSDGVSNMYIRKVFEYRLEPREPMRILILKPKHLLNIYRALKEFKHIEAGFGEEFGDLGAVKARLEIAFWWTRYALKNFKYPALQEW